MSDILYILNQLRRTVDTDEAMDNIRWLESNVDFDLFNQHLELCDQKTISRSSWEALSDAGIEYCGLFIDGKMVARACVEIITDDNWEVADVRVAHDFRNKGYARFVCKYVIRHILRSNKNAMIRTDKHNIAMQRVIARLGFDKYDLQENVNNPAKDI